MQSNEERIEELEAENHTLRQHLSGQHVDAARGHLQNTISKFAYDATGQDGEDEINAAAQGYCDTQDSELKYSDPERYAEMQMGC